MYWFFIYERFILGITDHEKMWHQDFFRGNWQNFFDIPSSVFFIALGWAIAMYVKRPFWQTLFLSMGAHIVADFFLHNDDAHRHFFPFDYRFMSPVSYWDPRYHGWLGSGIEMVFVLGSSVFLWKHIRSKWGKGALVVWNVVFVGGYVAKILR